MTKVSSVQTYLLCV